MIRIYPASDLPPEVPGMMITDGDDTAVLLNPNYVGTHGRAFSREVANSLLAKLDTPQCRLRAVG